MSLPRAASLLLRAFVPADRVEDLLGDLEEVHRERVARRGRWLAGLLTTLEAAEVAAAAGLLQLRGRPVVPMSWIDVKLGVRMLLKYPGLTLVGGLAMAFGIFVGAACYELYSQVLHPRLPFDEGDRVVAIELWDDRGPGAAPGTWHEFRAWQSQLTTIQELGAADFRRANLVAGDGPGEPVEAVAMTASAFPMTRVPPHLGRTLVSEDESPGSSQVVVVGYDVWRTRFAADPDVLGRMVVVDGVEHTVVGVMPSGFGFPLNQELWLPLPTEPDWEPLEGPSVLVFGRLAPGATIDLARAELDQYVARAASARPDVYEHLYASVRPYPEAFSALNGLAEGDGVEFWNVFAGLFLVLVCGNVSLLIFARAAAREGEIVVRGALGASRWRIVSQFFFEALVLGTVAGVVGVSAAGWGMGRLQTVLSEQLPAFWHHASLSPRTVAYAAVLTLLGAVVAGVLPGLKITSGDLDVRLRRQTSGGGGLRFGGVWTAVMVLQIAATVTFPVAGWFVYQDAVRIERQDLGFPSSEYLTFRLGLNAAQNGPFDLSAYEARLSGAVQVLSERLEGEASVAGVTVTRAVPGTHHVRRRIEVDAGGEAPRNRWDETGVGRRLRGGAVAANFFDVLGTAPTQGRTFDATDVDPEARTVIVNEPFVDEVLGGRNPIGRRVRYLSSNDYLSTHDEWDDAEVADEAGPWYRIVGVVPYLAMGNGTNLDRPRAGLYHAVAPGRLLGRTWLLVRVNGDAPAFTTRVREIAAEVDPDVALLDLQPLEAVKDAEMRGYRYGTWLMVGISGLAMLLSLAGIYSVTAFTVTRRTREIGVRVALGARPTQLAGATFRRPLTQVAAGLLVGLWLCVLAVDSAVLWGKPLLVLLGYTVVMAAVCALACVVPVRRALRVEPSDALAADG